MPPRPRCSHCSRNRQSTTVRTPFVANDRFTEYLPESAPVRRRAVPVCDDCYAIWYHSVVVALRPIMAERRRQDELARQAPQAPRLEVVQEAPAIAGAPVLSRIIRRIRTVSNTITVNTNTVVDDEDPKVITIVETKVRIVSSDPTECDADPENV